MASEHLSINGATELRKKLWALGKKGGRACLRKSTRKGANIVLKAARASAPVGPTGNYRRGFMLKPKQTEGVVSTWVRCGKKVTGEDGKKRLVAPHAALIEYGSKDRYRKVVSPGKYQGKMPAMHVMGKVVSDVGKQALEATVADLAERLTESAMGDGTGGGN